MREHTRDFVDDAREHDQYRRKDEYDERVLHESGAAGLRGAIGERQRERDGVVPDKR